MHISQKDTMHQKWDQLETKCTLTALHANCREGARRKRQTSSGFQAGTYELENLAINSF